MSAAQLELPTAAPALAFGAAVAALIPARPGPRTPGAESIDRLRAWATAQGGDYTAALRAASRGDLLRIGHALVAQGALPASVVPGFGAVEDARGDAWGTGWDTAPEGASRAQRADAAKRAQERHDAETLARLRRDLAPVVAGALATWARTRLGGRS